MSQEILEIGLSINPKKKGLKTQKNMNKIIISKGRNVITYVTFNKLNRYDNKN